MILNKIGELNDVTAGFVVQDSVLVYYTPAAHLRVVDNVTLKLSIEVECESAYSLCVIDGSIYLSAGSSLKLFSTSRSSIEEKCITEEQYVIALPKTRYLASSYYRESKAYRNIFLDEQCKVIYALDGELSYRDVHQGYILMSDRRGTRISLFDYMELEELWSSDLDDRISGSSLMSESLLIIPVGGNLKAYNALNGEEVWTVKSRLVDYHLVGLNLYGIAGNVLVVVDVISGAVNEKMLFPENINITPHLVEVLNQDIFFSGLKDGNIPIFGAFDIKEDKVLFMQEVSTVGESSFRKGLDKPVVNGNKLYIRDSENTLHVYECSIQA